MGKKEELIKQAKKVVLFSSSDLAKDLNMSRQLFFSHKHNGNIEEPKAETAGGTPLWTAEQRKRIREKFGDRLKKEEE